MEEERGHRGVAFTPQVNSPDLLRPTLCTASGSMLSQHAGAGLGAGLGADQRPPGVQETSGTPPGERLTVKGPDLLRPCTPPSVQPVDPCSLNMQVLSLVLISVLQVAAQDVRRSQAVHPPQVSRGGTPPVSSNCIRHLPVVSILPHVVAAQAAAQ